MTQQAQHRQCREKSCRQVMLVAVVAVVRQAVGICLCAGQMPAVCLTLWWAQCLHHSGGDTVLACLAVQMRWLGALSL